MAASYDNRRNRKRPFLMSTYEVYPCLMVGAACGFAEPFLRSVSAGALPAAALAVAIATSERCYRRDAEGEKEETDHLRQCGVTLNLNQK